MHPSNNAAPLGEISGDGETLCSEIVSDSAFVLTYSEVAEACRVSTRTVREWVLSHGLPVVRVGRSVRFRPEAVQAWLRSREGGAA